MSKFSENLKKLYFQKEYSKIISLINNELNDEDKNSGILNLLATCIHCQDDKINNKLDAINIFEASFLKEKNTKNAIEALSNFINLSIKLFNQSKTEDIDSIAKKNFLRAIYYYDNLEAVIKINENLLISIVEIYKKLADVDKTIHFLNKLLDHEFNDPMTIQSLIYQNNFRYNWLSKDYLKKGKFLQNNLERLDKDKLVPLKSEKNQKLKIGFFSADIFSNHSVSYFLKSILSNYDKDKFEIYLYLNQNNNKKDQTTEEFIKMVDRYIDISSLNDLDALNQIRSHNLNYAIDLMGVTSTNRINLFNNRISNKQILWCGYCNTTGLDNMDYIFADKHLIKDEEKTFYSEKIVNLPQIWNCHSGYEVERNFNEMPYLKNKYITFGSFNNYLKISDEVISTWSTILKRISNSKLILKPSSKREHSLLSSKFEKNGVLKSVIFHERKQVFKEHLNLYKNIDLSLDTFPYPGVTTSFESIWMGVPVITLMGFNFNSRCGVSINKNLGLDNLIATNIEDYINICSDLALNPDKLNQIRNNIFNNALKSPLFDQTQFREDFFKTLEFIDN